MKQERTIRPRDKGDVPDDPLSRMRHSASHVMADAVRIERRVRQIRATDWLSGERDVEEAMGPRRF